SMSARTAMSGFWLPVALIGSVRQITEPTYCLPLGWDGSSSRPSNPPSKLLRSSSYSTTRCATGAMFSDNDGGFADVTDPAAPSGWSPRAGRVLIFRGSLFGGEPFPAADNSGPPGATFRASALEAGTKVMSLSAMSDGVTRYMPS